MAFMLVKEVKDITRLEHILLVLAEGGFGYLVDKIKLKHKIPLSKRLKLKLAGKRKLTPEARLRIALERLGPTFVKFGQLLSVRPDLVPKRYIKELEKLQDNVPPFSFEKVEHQIKKELGKPINEIFSSFDKKPIASASVSQVHKAVLKNGCKVAVKVQRPNIQKIIERDIEIMFYIAKLAEKHLPQIRRYEPVSLVREFANWTKNEIDFRIEAENAHRFYRNFEGSDTVKIPKVYDNHTTSKVIVFEYIDGVEIRDLKEIKRRGLDLDRIIKNGFDAILTQVFIHGFFHADPHPSNILVMKDNVIAFVDFGIVGYFDEDLKKKSIDLFYGIIRQDTDQIVQTFLNMGVVEEDRVNINSFKNEVRNAIRPLEGNNLKDIRLSFVLEDVLNIALKYKIKMPLDFVLFGKTILTLEGIGLGYNPDFKFMDEVRPFAERLVLSKSNPRYAVDNFLKNALRFKDFIAGLPDKTDKLFEKIQSGKVKVDVEDEDVRSLSLEIDRSSNRLAYSMIIAALLVTGALLINVGDKSFYGMSFFSFSSFLLAMLLGFTLFVSVLRERKVAR